MLSGATFVIKKRKQEREVQMAVHNMADSMHVDTPELPEPSLAPSDLPVFPAAFDPLRPHLPRRSMPHRVHLAVSDAGSSWVGKVVVFGVLAVIIASCLMLVVESLRQFDRYEGDCSVCAPVDLANDTAVAERLGKEGVCGDCRPTKPAVFRVLETLFIAIFTAEYLVRLCTAWAVPDDLDLPNPPANQVPPRNAWLYLGRTIRFVVTPFNVVDLIAFLPFYIELAIGGPGGGFAVVRLLRLLRTFRVLRLGRFSENTLLFVEVFRRSRMGISILVLFTCIGMMLCGSLVFYAEQGSWDAATGQYYRDMLNDAEGKELSPFTSIPRSFWWVLVSFTTVGYGDMSPTTFWGQVIGTLTMYMGVLFMAMPITIVGMHFAEVYEELREQQRKRVQRSTQAESRIEILFGNIRKRGQLYAFRHWLRVTRDALRKAADVEGCVRRVLDDVLGLDTFSRRKSRVAGLVGEWISDGEGEGEAPNSTLVAMVRAIVEERVDRQTEELKEHLSECIRGLEERLKAKDRE